MIRRAGALMVALLATVGCASDGADPRDAGPATSAPTSVTATPVTATTPPTTAPASTPAPTPEPPGRLLVVGDSIAGQLFWALTQRSDVRGGPEVSYLLTAGPAFAEDWPDPLPELVDDPDDTAIVVSFGVWHASPPEPVAGLVDDVVGGAVDHTDTVAFLQPIAELGGAGATVHLLADIDDPEADARIQQVNADIAEAADEVGLPVAYLLSGRDGHQRAYVDIGDASVPVRNGADATHFCAAAALVMADGMLDELGVPARPVTRADIDQLIEASSDTSYFTTDGCD